MSSGPLSRVICLLLAFGIADTTIADDWPQLLGKSRNGTSAESGLIDRIPDYGIPVIWRAAGGVGMSAVAVSDGLAISSWNKGGKQMLVAMNAQTGETVWKTAIATAYKNGMGDGPRATPTIDRGAVYMLTGDGILCSADLLTGRLNWQVDTPNRFKVQPSEYGMASSPLVVGNVVVAHVGGPSVSVVAFDITDGSTVWKAGDGPAGYSSPVLLQVSGQPQVVSMTGYQLIGIDPVSGNVLWTYAFKTSFACNTANPIAVDGNIFISAGENHGCVLLGIESQDNEFTVNEIWASLETKSVMRNEWQTSIVVDGFLYGFDNVGAAGPTTHLSCIDVKTGVKVWRKNRFGKGNFVLADGKLWITTMDGELVLVAVDPTQFKELGRTKLLGSTRQTMSIANGKGYLRDDNEVLCIKLD